MAAILEGAGIEVHPANVNKVRLIAESTQKHDLGDARALANLLRLGYLPESYRVPDATHELRLILRHRTYLVRMRTSAKNRLHGMATTQGLHLIARSNPVSKAGKLGIMDGNNTLMKDLHTLIDELDRRIGECDVQCEEIARREPLVPILRSMPGIGIVTALILRMADKENDRPGAEAALEVFFERHHRLFKAFAERNNYRSLGFDPEDFVLRTFHKAFDKADTFEAPQPPERRGHSVRGGHQGDPGSHPCRPGPQDRGG